MIIKKNFVNFGFIFVVLINIIPITIKAEQQLDNDIKMEEQILEQISIDELNDYWQTLNDEYGVYLHEIRGKNLLDLIKNNGKLSFESTIKGLLTFLFYEIIVNGRLLGTLIILTLFSSILQTMFASFEKGTVSRVANFIVFSVLIFIALNSFYVALTYAKQAIHTMGDFMVALLPLILAIIASLGQLASVAIFQPIVILLIHFSSLLLSKIIFPLLYLSALLIIVSQFNETFKVKHLAELFRNISLGLLVIYLTVFIAILSIQGTASSIQDGVALKTTKFIAGNFIPVVGKTLTDAADTILSSALLLKNAIGIVGLVIIVLFAIFPALKIAVLAFIYKLVASLLQPLGENPIITTLNTISQYMMYILACLAIITFTFFLTIVIIISASNIPLLLR